MHFLYRPTYSTLMLIHIQTMKINAIGTFNQVNLKFKLIKVEYSDNTDKTMAECFYAYTGPLPSGVKIMRGITNYLLSVYAWQYIQSYRLSTRVYII